ncbi:MAG TPA: hypothetical protein VHK88_05745 [Aquihabitans sp.]|jgi:hypothetical protein|nr:hypothetical protein [Aquihabitans sp.]
MTRTPRTAAAAALCALALLAGCGVDDDGEATATTTTTAAPSTTAATSSTTGAGTEDDDATTTTEADDESDDEATTTTEADGSETTTTLDSEGRDTETSTLDTLPDGVHHGYLAGLEEGTVEGQDVQVVIFDEAELLTGQAAADEAAARGEEPSDYYVLNDDQTVKRIAVVPDASVTTLGGGPDPVPSSVSEVAFQDFLFTIDVATVRGVTTISSIEAVYLP